MKSFTLGKKERLKYQSRIDALFKEGIGFNVNPVRCVYQLRNEGATGSVKLLVSVPRRRFKKAVTRNRIKRLLREAYRLNKINITDEIYSTSTLNIGLIYIGDKVDISFKEIERSVVAALERLNASLLQPGR